MLKCERYIPLVLNCQELLSTGQAGFGRHVVDEGGPAVGSVKLPT